jgi:hypothetical protein
MLLNDLALFEQVEKMLHKGVSLIILGHARSHNSQYLAKLAWSATGDWVDHKKLNT